MHQKVSPGLVVPLPSTAVTVINTQVHQSAPVLVAPTASLMARALRATAQAMKASNTSSVASLEQVHALVSLERWSWGVPWIQVQVHIRGFILTPINETRYIILLSSFLLKPVACAYLNLRGVM